MALVRPSSRGKIGRLCHSNNHRLSGKLK
jgi:hypothetical protein